jgi:hypothetical protein
LGSPALGPVGGAEKPSLPVARMRRPHRFSLSTVSDSVEGHLDGISPSQHTSYIYIYIYTKREREREREREINIIIYIYIYIIYMYIYNIVEIG